MRISWEWFPSHLNLSSCLVTSVVLTESLALSQRKSAKSQSYRLARTSPFTLRLRSLASRLPHSMDFHRPGQTTPPAHSPALSAEGPSPPHSLSFVHCQGVGPRLQLACRLSCLSPANLPSQRSGGTPLPFQFA